MNEPDCVDLLHWVLPRLGLRWEGFRRVRRQVCKRITRRIVELGLPGYAAYRQHVEAHPEEAAELETLCRVHVSRFYRDRRVFDELANRVLPALAAELARRGERVLRIWSAGCAAGEEPYTVALIEHFVLRARFPDVSIQILATDADAGALERARGACYPAASLKELPAGWQAEAFTRREGRFCLRDELKSRVELRREDVRQTMPDGPFHLILCRNSLFTYLAEPVQQQVAERLIDRLAPGGALVIGAHERLPAGAVALRADPRLAAIRWNARVHP